MGSPVLPALVLEAPICSVNPLGGSDFCVPMLFVRYTRNRVRPLSSCAWAPAVRSGARCFIWMGYDAAEITWPTFKHGTCPALRDPLARGRVVAGNHGGGRRRPLCRQVPWCGTGA